MIENDAIETKPHVNVYAVVWGSWSVRWRVSLILVRFALGLLLPWRPARSRDGRIAGLKRNMGGALRACRDQRMPA